MYARHKNKCTVLSVLKEKSNIVKPSGVRSGERGGNTG
jgi:hypothetical protein